VSVGSTIISLYKIKIDYAPRVSGHATDDGTVDVDVMGFASVVVNSNVDFGESMILSGAGNFTTITTETNHSDYDGIKFNTSFYNCSHDVNWSNASHECRGIELENDGNVYLNITMYASEDANTFWRGENSTDEFKFAILDGNRSHEESSSCNNNSNYNGTSYENVSTYPTHSIWTSSSSFAYNWTDITTSATLICTNLSFTDAADTITVEFNLSIPSDEPVTTKQNTFTFTAAQI